MNIFKPSRTADFLRSRTLFFVCAISLNLVWSIVAALDVSSVDTRRSSVHVAIAAYNLAIQLVSFLLIACITILDSTSKVKDTWWCSHVLFEISVYCFLATLQLAGALAYSALVSRFYCSASDACLSFNRALLVGSWTITIIYILFAIWFTCSVFAVSKYDPSVWKSRSKTYDWETGCQQSAKLITPSSPMDILGSNMSQVKNKIRVTWIIPARLQRHNKHPAVASTPHLPIQAIPPATPAVPPLPLAYQRQSVPEDAVSYEEPSGRLRPLSLVKSQLLQTPPQVRRKSKFMSIKPLRLHRPNASLDNSLGISRGLTISRPQMTPAQYSGWSDVPTSWPSSGSTTFGREFAEQAVQRESVVPSMHTYSTRASTVPPTPPPKDFRTHTRARPGMQQYGSLDSLYPTSSTKTRRYI